MKPCEHKAGKTALTALFAPSNLLQTLPHRRWCLWDVKFEFATRREFLQSTDPAWASVSTQNDILVDSWEASQLALLLILKVWRVPLVNILCVLFGWQIIYSLHEAFH